MNKINLKNLIWKEGEFYVSQCLNVDVSSFGETRKEALNNLNEALELYFEDAQKPEVSNIIKPEIISFPFTYA